MQRESSWMESFRITTKITELHTHSYKERKQLNSNRTAVFFTQLFAFIIIFGEKCFVLSKNMDYILRKFVLIMIKASPMCKYWSQNYIR